MPYSKYHFIAVFGGSVAGSEAAFQLAQRGFRVVVFDQNKLPYGKIEDGLPLWHVRLRDKEENLINKKLDHENIRFIPMVKLGQDIEFNDVVNNWGFSAIILATGAWHDRPMAIDGIEKYIGNGLIYQNPFMFWFNHKHEIEYEGPDIRVEDNTLVVGGGLASLDVIKACMIELVSNALIKIGIETNLFELERGIKGVLEKYDLNLSDLGINGCTLVYRRRAQDMPLTNRLKNTPEEIEKAVSITIKILNNFKEKYLFRFEECLSPLRIIEGSNGKIEGLVLQKMKVKDGTLTEVPDETKTISCKSIISSIGSLPEPIEGVPTDGPVYKIADPVNSKVAGYDNVFAVGNAVTGRGNIKDSLLHGKETTLNIIDDYLEFEAESFSKMLRRQENRIDEQTANIAEQVAHKKFENDNVIQSILDKTTALQKKSNCNGNYMDWIRQHLPERLESMVNH